MKYLFFFVFSAVGLHALSQDTALRVMFYNVENLFDTLDTPDKKDEEFLPNSPLNHGTRNYNLKQNNIAKVINAAFGMKSPDIIGLCEIENEQVVQDLSTRLTPKKGWGIVHKESPDGRGIDNALIYDTKNLKLLNQGAQEVIIPGQRPTRLILWAHFSMKKNDRELIFFVNHWPSRYGGKVQSEPKRIEAAKALANLTYELREKYPDADQIAMGDFNDYPKDQSVKIIESCIYPESPCFKNAHEYLQDLGQGSHAYKGEWGMLDQILVSRGLYSGKNKYYVPNNSGQIVRYDWMMYESNYDQKLYPSRFYGRDKVFGGYSDHLPVTVTILKK